MICYMARLNYTQTAKCYMKSASSKAGGASKYPNMPIRSMQAYLYLDTFGRDSYGRLRMEGYWKAIGRL